MIKKNSRMYHIVDYLYVSVPFGHLGLISIEQNWYVGELRFTGPAPPCGGALLDQVSSSEAGTNAEGVGARGRAMLVEDIGEGGKPSADGAGL